MTKNNFIYLINHLVIMEIKETGFTINDWRFAEKHGLAKIKARILKENIRILSNYHRNFEFNEKRHELFKNAIIKRCPSQIIKILKNDEMERKKGIFIEDIEFKNGLYIAINGETNIKPYWGYIGINKINRKNQSMVKIIVELADTIFKNHPINLNYKVLMNPIMPYFNILHRLY